MSRAAMVLTFLMLVILTTAFAVRAAAPDVDWVKTYGDSMRNYAYWIEELSTQGYVLTGLWESAVAGDFNAFLMRTTASGDTIWTKTYGSQLVDGGICVRETSDRGYIVVGYTERAPGNEDAWFVRTDANGDTLWTSVFDFGATDILMCVVEMPGGDFIACGYTSSLGDPDSTDVLVLKIDEDGRGLWKLLWDRPGNDRGAELCRTSDGNVAVAGFAGTATGLDDFLVLKVDDSTGDTLWTRTYGDTTDDMASGILETPDGGLLVCGGMTDPVEGSEVAFLMKTDANGDSTWTKTYGSATDRQYLNSVALTPDLGYIFGGRRDTSATYDFDFYFMKTDSNGDSLWTKVVGDADWQLMTCMTTTRDLGYVASGYTREPYVLDRDVYIVKLGVDEAGVGSLDERPGPRILAVDGPNPFRDSIPVRYEIPAAGHVRLAVYDVAGRHVVTLADGLRSEGHHRAAWDCSGERGGSVKSGVYFIRLETSDRIAAEKVIVLR